MKARKLPPSSVVSEVRASTSSQTTASEGSPRAARSAAFAASEICESICSREIEPVAGDAELLEVVDHDAGVLAGDVAEDHVARRAARGARQVDQVAGRGRRFEQVEDLLGEVGGHDDPQVDHRRSVSAPWSRRRRPSRLGPMLTDYHLHLRPDEDDTPPERYFTADNVDRYLEAAEDAGIAELGVSEHVHRFRQALELWRHPFWEEQALDDLDAYCEFVRGDAAAARDRVRLRPRRRGPHRHAARGARLRLRGRLGPLRRRRGRRPSGLGRLGGQRRPRRGLAPLLRGARRVRPLGPLRHPRPPRPGQGLGQRPGRCPTATRATTTSPPSRRSPRAASRSRSRPPACASRSASSTPRPPSPRCASRRAPASRSPPTPICPSRSATATTGRWPSSPSSASPRSPSSSGARRRMEPLGAAVGEN